MTQHTGSKKSANSRLQIQCNDNKNKLNIVTVFYINT